MPIIYSKQEHGKKMFGIFRKALGRMRSGQTTTQAATPQQAGIFIFEISAELQVTVNNLNDLTALAREVSSRQKELFYKAYRVTNRFRDFVDNFNYHVGGGACSISVERFIALATAFPGQLNERSYFS